MVLVKGETFTLRKNIDLQRWFMSKIRNISGCEYFAEMMEMEHRFLAQNRPKIIVQALVFP